MMFVVSLGLGGLCGWALLNDWGIRLYGAGLEPEVARWFYLGLTVLAALILVLGILAVSAGRREVMITAHRIVLPVSEYSSRTVEIAPGEIRDISFGSYNGVHTATIRHVGGTVRLRSPHFASQQHFSDCVNWINSAWRAA